MSQTNFELNFATRRQLGYELIDLINDYFESLSARPVQPPVQERSFEPLSDPMPETGVLRHSAEHSGMNGNAHEELTGFLRQTAQDLIGNGFHLASANYFGLMNPTPTYAGVLAEGLVAAFNPQLATTGRSQLAIRIEAETIRWVGERFGWRQPFDGSFTSGGNEANFSALAMALATHSRMRWRTVSHQSVPNLSSTPRAKRIIRWTNPSACSDWDARRCGACH